MRVEVEYVAQVRCRKVKVRADGTPYELCYVLVPLEHREKLKGRWVKVRLLVI